MDVQRPALAISPPAPNHGRMQTELTELTRRLDNLIRIGTVSAIDLTGTIPLCRVLSGNLETDWLVWAVARAGSARSSHAPSLGEQVIVLSPSGELGAGLVIACLNSDAYPTPDHHPTRHRTVYPDGAVMEYDPETGGLLASGIRTAHIVAATRVVIDCPETEVTGNLSVQGHTRVVGVLTYQGGLTNDGSSSGATIHGPVVQTGGELSSNGVVLHRHIHPGDSGGETGAPR